MKIISWNVRNLSTRKMNLSFSTTFKEYGLGDRIRDYVLNVVMAQDCWSNIQSSDPVDFFVMIEMICGGRKNSNATGKINTNLNHIAACMNSMVMENPDYNYTWAQPLVIGGRETVGLIYNSNSYTFIEAELLRNSYDNLITPRAPIRYRFHHVDNPKDIINIIGIHPPPASGGDSPNRYEKPIKYLRNVAGSELLEDPATYVAGDFNCAPNSTYDLGMGEYGWEFENYGTAIPNGTLSGVRQAPATDYIDNRRYLTYPYDNILTNETLYLRNESVLDIIGNARNVNEDPPESLVDNHLTALLNNYNKITDHLPVMLED